MPFDRTRDRLWQSTGLFPLLTLMIRNTIWQDMLEIYLKADTVVYSHDSDIEVYSQPSNVSGNFASVQQQRRQQQGKVTVKYDRKELRKRLVLEEWIVEQLGQLYGCQEEEMPDVEIDIDDLLDAANEEERALKLQETLVDCYKPTEEFIKELLTRIRGMRKLSPPQKKTI
ncbi:PREDICTED: protein phosphatase 1 regulatory subunit 14C [Crocodylus porosus]|uniref:protein phosphatase 1 regulatory subunit 14C n=1 Tax=Crocodylus porosus TaxID=8502 RepID=UPI000938BC90|nr:PREDICTED: protein phosphatase 1 regulatory subunit 14C [Crocodylus porosus]